MKQWNGEGLPPVGTECEYADYKGNWHKIYIVARHLDATFVEWRSNDFKGSDIIRGEISEKRFRPVQTFEEKQLENFKKVFDAIQDKHGRATVNIFDAICLGKLPLPAAPGFEWRYVCSTCGCRVEPGKELPHGC